MVKTKIKSSKFENLNISYTSASGICTTLNTDGSTWRIWIRPYNPTKEGSSICFFIDEIEFCEGSRENIWSIANILIIFISHYISIKIFISRSDTKSTSIIVSISIVVSILKCILPISLVRPRVIKIRAIIFRSETSTCSHSIDSSYSTTTEIKAKSIIGWYNSVYCSSTTIIPNPSREHIMSCSFNGTVTITIPVFFVVKYSTFFDACNEFLTKKIEFFKKLNSIFCFDSCKWHILHGDKYGYHNSRKDCHPEHNLNERESSVRGIICLHGNKHVFEKSIKLQWEHFVRFIFPLDDETKRKGVFLRQNPYSHIRIFSYFSDQLWVTKGYIQQR